MWYNFTTTRQKELWATQYLLRFMNSLRKNAAKKQPLWVVEALESSIKEAIKEGKAEAKSDISEELKKELATKYDVALVKKDIDILREEMHKEIDIVRKEMKIMEIRIIAILIIVMILLNPGALKFLARLLGILK